MPACGMRRKGRNCQEYLAACSSEGQSGDTRPASQFRVDGPGLQKKLRQEAERTLPSPPRPPPAGAPTALDTIPWHGG